MGNTFIKRHKHNNFSPPRGVLDSINRHHHNTLASSPCTPLSCSVLGWRLSWPAGQRTALPHRRRPHRGPRGSIVVVSSS
eukprot:3028930-Rhodomonas_salina.1